MRSHQLYLAMVAVIDNVDMHRKPAGLIHPAGAWYPGGGLPGGLVNEAAAGRRSWGEELNATAPEPAGPAVSRPHGLLKGGRTLLNGLVCAEFDA
jgi:hypothetical protein